jgi:hypothetical protein
VLVLVAVLVLTLMLVLILFLLIVVGSLVDDTQSEVLGPNNEPDKSPPLWAPTVGA